jgi:hypothetical protein
MRVDIGAQIGDAYQSGMKRHVRSNDSFGQWISASELDHHAEGRRGPETAPCDHLLGRKVCAPNVCAGSAAASNPGLEW